MASKPPTPTPHSSSLERLRCSIFNSRTYTFKISFEKIKCRVAFFFFFFLNTCIPALNFPENQSPSGTCVFKTNFFDHDIFVYFKSKILNKRQQIKVTIELNKIISFLKCSQFHRVFPINSCSERSSPVRDNKTE